MPNWNTEVIKAALTDLGTIDIGGAGGSYDTEQVRVYPTGGNGEWISVIGFRPDKALTDEEHENAEDVTYAEVRTDGSSRGGLQTENDNVGMAYGRIVSRINRMGFQVIPHYDQIF